MKHICLCLLVASFGAALHPGAVSAQPYLGLKVTTQRWTPLRPVDTPVVEIDDDDLLSEAFDKAAQNASAKLKAALVTALSRGDLLAKGVTLYDVRLDLKKPYLSVSSVEGAGTAGNPLRANLTVSFVNIGMTATATTPNVAGGVGVDRAADPRCELRFSAQINMQLGITNNLNAPLFSDQLSAQSRPVIEITEASLGGRNVACSAPIKVANTVINILGIRDAMNALGRVALSELSKDISAQARPLLANIIETANKAVAAKLAAASKELAEFRPPEVANIPQDRHAEIRRLLQSLPGNLLVQGWLADGGRGRKIVINIAPAAPIRDLPPHPFVAISGPFQVGDAIGASGRVSVKCEALPIRVRRVTGPRRMLNASGALGPPPLEDLKVTTGCSNNTYSTSGLSLIFPHVVMFESIGRRSGGANVCQGHLVTPQGWNSGQIITPQERSKSYPVLVQFASVPCGANQNAVDLSIARRIDSRVNPAPVDGVVTRPRVGDVIGSQPQLSPRQVTPPAGPVLR